jgi:hypothetical protein
VRSGRESQSHARQRSDRRGDMLAKRHKLMDAHQSIDHRTLRRAGALASKSGKLRPVLTATRRGGHFQASRVKRSL